MRAPRQGAPQGAGAGAAVRRAVWVVSAAALVVGHAVVGPAALGRRPPRARAAGAPPCCFGAAAGHGPLPAGRLAARGVSPRQASRCRLRVVPLAKLPYKQLRYVVESFGVHLDGESKADLILHIDELRLPDHVLSEAVAKAAAKWERKASKAAERQSSHQNSRWPFSSKELRLVLDLLGCQSVASMSRERLEQAMDATRATNGEVRRMLKEVEEETGFRAGHDAQRKGASRNGAPSSDGKQPKRKKKKRRMSREEQYLAGQERLRQERKKRAEAQKRREARWEMEDDLEFLRSVGADDYEPVGRDDEYDFVVEGDPWRKHDKRARAERKAERAERKARAEQKARAAERARARAAEEAEAGPGSRPYHSWFGPFDGAAHRAAPGAGGSGRRAAAPAPAPPADPEEVMHKALRQNWNCEHLGRAQAARLLGLSLHPSEEEVRAARKTFFHRWHPDRNPDDPNASSALRLVLAAIRLLGS